MCKKTFSLLNFSLLLSGLIILISCIYFSIDSIYKIPSTLIFAVIVLVCSLFVLYIKFPIFIENVNYENISYSDDDIYIKKISWFTCLYYSIFTAEPSKFLSLFSKKYLIFHKNSRNCNFNWKYEKPNIIHKILDIVFMVALICTSIIISKILCRWADITNIYFYILIFIIALLTMFKRIILSYSLSIKIEEQHGCNINVIYPYSTSRFSLMKQFGQAMPFSKTIMITQNVFFDNQTIKDYIIAHEVGHTHDKIRTFLIMLSSVISMAFLSFLPFWLANNGLTWLVIFPFILYFLYSMTLGYKLREKSEFFADAYAVKLIGKERCLVALNLLKAQHINNKKTGTMYNVFFKVISIEEKIKFINEYQEKN